MSLIFLIISIVINVILDILLIKSFSMGIKGAALATVISSLFPLRNSKRFFEAVINNECADFARPFAWRDLCAAI